MNVDLEALKERFPKTLPALDAFESVSLKESFEYHRDGYLVNKVQRGRTAKVGERTCCPNRKSYGQVSYNGTVVREHVIIYSMFNGPIVEGDVDHIDGDVLNNKIENLRLISHKHNVRRANYGKGVTLDKRNGRWLAAIYVNNVKKHLGSFATKVEAEGVRAEAERKYWGTDELPN